jgi:hypothetical protein
VEQIVDVVAKFAARVPCGAQRPVVIAIDGRSSSGKTTLAARIADVIPSTAVVHTDDIAWWHSRFGWADLAVRVLEAVHAGEAVSFRPPAWDERGREGAIVVPRGMQLVLLEGVGASREELAHLLDARLWVQSDQQAIERRNAARTADEGWLAEEVPFVAARRPWERAELVMCGTPSLACDARSEIVVAAGPL